MRLLSSTGVNPAGKIRRILRKKPIVNFMASLVWGIGKTKTMLKRENDGSHKNLGRQSYENGRG